MKTFYMFQRITNNPDDAYIYTYIVSTEHHETLMFESKEDEAFWRRHFNLPETEWRLMKLVPA